MVYPAANRGGSRRDGFGAGRDGRGTGRMGRHNVWQCTGRNIPDGREEGELDSSQDREDPRPEAGAGREHSRSAAEDREVGHRKNNSNWDKEANPRNHPAGGSN